MEAVLARFAQGTRPPLSLHPAPSSGRPAGPRPKGGGVHCPVAQARITGGVPSLPVLSRPVPSAAAEFCHRWLAPPDPKPSGPSPRGTPLRVTPRSGPPQKAASPCQPLVLFYLSLLVFVVFWNSTCEVESLHGVFFFPLGKDDEGCDSLSVVIVKMHRPDRPENRGGGAVPGQPGCGDRGCPVNVSPCSYGAYGSLGLPLAGAQGQHAALNVRTPKGDGSSGSPHRPGPRWSVSILPPAAPPSAAFHRVRRGAPGLGVPCKLVCPSQVFPPMPLSCVGRVLAPASRGRELTRGSRMLPGAPRRDGVWGLGHPARLVHRRH